ncbi:MAG: hypothetical protein CSA42_08135 [Gammaproteobacteria bacterium]|nr:MAG: hypothetical protein CSA42_08135 [Gammaproteobacteria bacterium]
MQRIELSHLKCPSCNNEVLLHNNLGIHCDKCDTQFFINDGVIDFLPGISLDTQLDLESYDSNHGVDEDNSKSIFNLYDSNIAKYSDIEINEVLEIGSGTGNLTHGLCSYSSLNKIHCSDVSLRFIERLKLRIESTKHRDIVLIYRFDANHLPFRDNSMDSIVGHSILHHLEYFERTLSNVFQVLKKGGVAMFGEPILNTYAFVSLAASLIFETNKNMLHGIIKEKEKMVLKSMALKALKMRNNIKEKERINLQKIEDKFRFPIEYMNSISQEIGFQKMEVVQWAEVSDLGEVVKKEFKMVLMQNDCDTDFLEQFDYIFNAIGNSYGKALDGYLSQVFAFFLFKK